MKKMEQQVKPEYLKKLEEIQKKKGIRISTHEEFDKLMDSELK